jgi:hypothetical protein
MPSSTRKTAHKLGPNRKETAKKSRRARNFSESTDVHEDRGTVKSKLGRSQPAARFGLPQPGSHLPQRASAPGARVPTSTRLLPEHTAGAEFHVVHFHFFKEGARKVAVAGTFNNWHPRRTRLHQNGVGEWEVDLSLAPGDYEYRFFVDGQWADDPLSCRHAPNPFGGLNAVLHVRRGETGAEHAG